MFRISLWSLLLLTSLVAMAIGSLKYATQAWLAIVMGGTLVIFLIAVIDAAIDRRERQAFAIGFALCFVIYIYVVAAAPLGFDVRLRSSMRLSPELDLDAGRLPTTYVLRRLHARIQRMRWIDSATGRVIGDVDPTDSFARPNSAGLVGTAVRRQLPQEDRFAPIGHCWWALVLGYSGGWIARSIYLRRMRERESPAAADRLRHSEG